MYIRRRKKTSVLLELEEWEARDLMQILRRIQRQKTVGKSEFSLREKITGRKLVDQLSKLCPIEESSSQGNSMVSEFVKLIVEDFVFLRDSNGNRIRPKE